MIDSFGDIIPYGSRITVEDHKLSVDDTVAIRFQIDGHEAREGSSKFARFKCTLELTRIRPVSYQQTGRGGLCLDCKHLTIEKDLNSEISCLPPDGRIRILNEETSESQPCEKPPPPPVRSPPRETLSRRLSPLLENIVTSSGIALSLSGPRRTMPPAQAPKRVRPNIASPWLRCGACSSPN